MDWLLVWDATCRALARRGPQRWRLTSKGTGTTGGPTQRIKIVERRSFPDKTGASAAAAGSSDAGLIETRSTHSPP
jgi:hypothetical protein